MKIRIMGKEQCRSYTYSEEIKPCVIISINDLGGHAHSLKNHENIKDVLVLFFDDIIREDVEVAGDEGLFNQDHVKQIDKFIKRWEREVEEVIVHCSQGISRSSAVAAGICLKLNQEDKWIWECDQYDPNPYVYEMMTYS